MSAYKKQHSLLLKAFYNARKVLSTKECTTENENVLPVNIASKSIHNEHAT